MVEAFGDLSDDDQTRLLDISHKLTDAFRKRLAELAAPPKLNCDIDTEATVIRNGENGFVHTDVDALVDAMSVLLGDPAEARRLGAGARCTALKRFNIDRFTRDWHETLLHVTA